MNDIIKEYTKVIGREKRLNIMVWGLVFLFFMLCLTFAIFLVKIEAQVLRSRTALDMNDGSIRKVTLLDAVTAREMEAMHQSRYFIDNFFQFDKSNYNQHLNRGLWLGDNSVRDVYKDLVKKGWYNNVIENNIRQYAEYKENDIQINYDKKPFQVTANFNIVLRGDDDQEESHPVTIKFNLADCDRDFDKNPHGFEVENLEITQFK